MTTGLKRKLGYADYARLPDDGRRYEVLDGELYASPSPSPLHQRLAKRLARTLEDYFETRGLGEVFFAPTDLILARHDIAVPDLLVVGDPAQISRRGIERAPLLVVEILSPRTRSRDRGVKMRRYAAQGVPHYWLVDPKGEGSSACASTTASIGSWRRRRSPRPAPPGVARAGHRPGRSLARIPGVDRCRANLSKPVTLSGALGEDARHYQVRAVQLAIQESKK